MTDNETSLTIGYLMERVKFPWHLITMVTK